MDIDRGDLWAFARRCLLAGYDTATAHQHCPESPETKSFEAFSAGMDSRATTLVDRFAQERAAMSDKPGGATSREERGHDVASPS